MKNRLSIKLCQKNSWQEKNTMSWENIPVESQDGSSLACAPCGGNWTMKSLLKIAFFSLLLNIGILKSFKILFWYLFVNFTVCIMTFMCDIIKLLKVVIKFLMMKILPYMICLLTWIRLFLMKLINH